MASGYARHPGIAERGSDAAIRQAHFREMIEHHVAEHPPTLRVYNESGERMYIGIGTVIVMLLIVLIIYFVRRA